MKKMMLILLSVGVMIGLSGCFGTMQISTCKEYKDGICTVKKLEDVKQCEKPLIINGKTYCR